MNFDSLHNIAIFDRRFHGVFHVYLFGTVQRRIEMSFHAADQIGRNETHDTACRRLDDEFAKARDGHSTWTTLINQGRDTGPHPDPVGLEPKAPGDMAIDVGVGVDQSREHISAGNINHPLRTL